jgi:hypothetical protein
MDSPENRTGACSPEFFKGMLPDTSQFRILGRIKLGDSGFSVRCHEDDAIAILRREACSLGADAVTITEERRAHFWSSCYRARAVFLKRKQSATATADNSIVIGAMDEEGYAYETDSSAVANRVQSDKKRNAILVLVSAIAGAVIGIMIGLR